MDSELLRRRILRQLAPIAKAAKASGMTGTVNLHFANVHPDQFEAVLASITEYKVYRHYVSVSDRLQVALLLD